ncbi:MAG: hypothetical protein WC718_16850 [Phycisphaerales bacterium]|jgi:hypothetical protein
MNDAEYAAQKARVQKLIDKWLLPLGLKYWNVTVDFDRTEYVGRDDDEAANWKQVAKCAVRWQYFQAHMTWRLLVTKDASDEELERYFLHECMHVFLHEMREDDPELAHEERVASMLANAFWWVHTTMAEASAGSGG